MNTVIDLNADLGESPWESGVDHGLLGIVTSANVACGGHAGDASTMRAVCAEATRRGVLVGAQVSYADREGFGRRPMSPPAAQLEDALLSQLDALGEIARSEGSEVAYCKPHGALYNTIARDAAQAETVARACAAFRPGLPVLGLPGSVWLEVARAHGLAAVGEAFADRAYASDGSLVPRTEDGAVLHDAEVIAPRVVEIVRTRSVRTVTGETMTIEVGSVCVHGDTPGALVIAARVRERLEAAGVRIASFVERL